MTDLPPLTYPLIIEELRPEEPPRGRFSFPSPHPEPHPMDLVFAPSQVESWPIARLRPYARNAKMHGDDQVAKIAASMARFGWTMPCMVADDGELIAGHGRVLAATMLGLTEVPVIQLTTWIAQSRAIKATSAAALRRNPRPAARRSRRAAGLRPIRPFPSACCRRSGMPGVRPRRDG